MLQTKSSTVKVIGAAILAPVAVIMQNLPPLFVTPWFMRIDLVAVPWIICWYIFDLKTALLCLTVSAPLIGFLGPYAGGFVGMVMKPVASVWLILIPAVFAHLAGGVQKLREKKLLLLCSILAALATRAIVSLIFNFYFAFPLFFGMTPEMIVDTFTALQSFVARSFGLIGLGAYVAEIVFWNILQGAVDTLVAFPVGDMVSQQLQVKNQT